MMPIADARRAERYYTKSDGGYYLGQDELHTEWGGKGAALLALSGQPEFEQFQRLIHGLDPKSANQLTAKLIDERIPAWDVTASVPKGVTLALECGDSRIQQMIWEAGREAMADIEAYATTRVRKGGLHEDRKTGNLVWFATEHTETRPTAEDNMPDPDRHIHFVVFNSTFDEKEREWKALKFRPIMEQRKYFDRRFDMRLAAKLADAGYRIETKWKGDDKARGAYHSWDIAGIPRSLIEKNSRRSQEVDATEAAILAKLKDELGEAPDKLSAVSRDQLGAISRRTKREDLTLAECRAYWQSRITDNERAGIKAVIARAQEGNSPPSEQSAASAVAFSLNHHFERYSVVPVEQLAVTAMERSLGDATPEDIERELHRQGVLTQTIDGRKLATTEALQREEDAIVGFAANGRGSVAPIGLPERFERGSLNQGQFDAVAGLLGSSNRVNLVEGPAGAGKSFMLKAFDTAAKAQGQNVFYLATTTDAANVLARDGFTVNTVARFLVDEKLQNAATGCRVVVDESSMMGHKDAHRFFTLAQKLNLKPIMVGDPAQHGAVPRGALLHVLKTYAGIQPFRLTEIMRQESEDYRQAARLMAEGKTLEGFDSIDAKGWIREIGPAEERNREIAAEYVQARLDKKSVLVVSPTHAEAASITSEIRAQLREKGLLKGEDRQFTRLVAANATEAERGQLSTYREGDVLVFHQNARQGYRKGDWLTVTDPAKVPVSEAAKFQLYRKEAIQLAVGDQLRITGQVKSLDGKHKLVNGATQTVAGFTRKGDIQLGNGWVIPACAGFFRHGVVETSFGAQGKSVQRAIVAVSAQSLPATNQEMAYVASTRAREQMTLYTDDKAALRESIQISSQKLTALDMKPKQLNAPSLKEKLRRLVLRRKRTQPGVGEHFLNSTERIATERQKNHGRG